MQNKISTMIRQMLTQTLFTVAVLFLCAIPSTTSAAVFTFNASIEAPTSVHAFPTAGHTRLTWQAASGTTPVLYKVYSRLSNEPDYYPAGTASTNQFDTTYTFAGVNDTVTRLFVVSAVSAGGMESALSEPVMDNDQDGDGITDLREADYGTSVTAADTDGDVLTDGQEAFIYHTNPLVADTDSDGVNDYQEVINEIRENLPPFAVADTATTTAGVSVAVSVLANDFGGIATSTFALATPPLHGSATVSTTTGMVSYTPASDYAGTDQLGYSISNKNGVTSTSTVTFTVLAATSTAATTTATTSPLTDGLAAYWKLDETSGNATDATGNGNTLTNNGTTPFTQGVVGNSASFSSSNQYFSATSNFGINSSAQAYSVSLWINPQTAPNTSQYTYLWTMEKGSGQGYSNAVYDGRTGTSRIYVDGEVGPFNINLTGAWHHVVLTKAAGAGGTTKLYVDGNLLGTGTSGTVGGSSAVFGLANPGSPLNSIKMDEAAVYLRELSVAEVNDLYNNGSGLQHPFSTSSSGTTTATTTPVTSASTTPITLDTTTFARAVGNTVSVSHTIGAGTASTSYRLLLCGTSAQTSGGTNVVATQVTFGASSLTKASTYLAEPTLGSTPTELWYLENAPVGTGSVTLTAPSTAATASVVCTSFNDFYWYHPGQAFTWVPNTNPSATSTATTTPPAATTTPPVATSTAPISIATTTFARANSNTVTLSHTIDQGTSTTTHRLLMCGIAAHDASGANVAATQVSYGSLALTKSLTYSAAPTASTTPTELWYLEEVSPGTNTLTVTAPSTAVSTAAVCTSFHDFYWYIPGRVFGW